MKAKKNRGGYRKTEFGDLMKSNPEQAAAMLRNAWTEAGGSKKAAKTLDISQRSFFRCAVRLKALGFDIVAPSETSNAGIDTVRR
jgi:hypothetical protein